MPWGSAEAAAYLSANGRSVLDSATIQTRSRTCPGGVCGDWGVASDWTIRYLTYSGGGSTRWKNVLAEFNLVLFDDNGTAKFSMQHDTFNYVSSSYGDEDGVLYAFPLQSISYPHLRAYNTPPKRSNADYDELDWQVVEDVVTVGDGCLRWTATPFGVGQPDLEQHGVLFRW